MNHMFRLLIDIDAKGAAPGHITVASLHRSVESAMAKFTKRCYKDKYRSYKGEIIDVERGKLAIELAWNVDSKCDKGNK